MRKANEYWRKSKRTIRLILDNITQLRKGKTTTHLVSDKNKKNALLTMRPKKTINGSSGYGKAP